MARDHHNGEDTPSTTWQWERVILRGPPDPTSQAAAKRKTASRLRTRDPRKPLPITISYLGGPRALWVVKARGVDWYFSGVQALQDVMKRINRTQW